MPPEPLPPLYLITDAARVGSERVVEVAAAAVSGGLEMVLVREPQWPVARVAQLLERLGSALPPHVVRLVSSRPGPEGLARQDLVRELGLRGVHVGGGEVAAVEEARARLGEGVLVGYSAHAVEEARAALRAGADHVSLSPVFPPLSKRLPQSGALTPIGIEGLRAACVRIAGPVYALGGITEANVGQVREAGAAGAAVIGALIDAPDPAASARALLAPWRAKRSNP